MTVQTAVGTFTIASTATAGTTQAITCGFQPKAIIFWLCGNAGTTDTVTNATVRYGMGVATGTADRRSVGSLSVHGAATIDGGRIIRADACVAVSLNTSAVDGLLDINSMDANGFTVVVDDQFSVNLRISYFAIGGDSITNAATGTFTCPITTGNFDITSLAFQPDFVLLLSNSLTSDAPATSASRDFFTVGAAVSSTQRGVVTVGEGPENNQTSQVKSYAYDGEALAVIADTPTSLNTRADFVSFLSNGFRLNFLKSGSGLTYRVPFLAIKGGSWRVDNLLTQTDTTTAIVENGFGFTPKGAMLFSHNMAKSTQDTVQANGRLSIGAFTDASNRVAQAMLQEDGLATMDTTQAIEHDEVYINLNTNVTVQGLMDVQSVDSGSGFTFIMDDADPSQAFVWYFAVGDAGNQWTLTASPAAASATPAVGLTVDRKVTGATTSASNTAGGDVRVARKLTVSATAASNAVGADLTVQTVRSLTATAASASNTATVGLSVVRKVTATGTQPSNTAGGDLRILRRVTVSLTAASNAVGGDVRVARKMTATAGSASATAGGDLQILRRLTRTGTAASNTAGADLRVLRRLSGTATGASNTATVGVTVARKVTASLTAASNAVGAALGVKYGRTATATSASNTATVGVTVARKVTASLTGASATGGSDLRSKRTYSVNAGVASVGTGADLRILRRVTATLTAASLATGVELAVNTGFTLTATVAVGSATVGADLRVARRVTATLTAASLATGAALGVKYGRTATGASASNTGGGDLRILRQVTVNQTVVSVALGAELTVQAGLTFNAAVTVVSATVGADLRIARRLTATVVSVSVTVNANLTDTQGVNCQVHSTTGTATLAVNYRRQATVTVASGAWGNDLYRNVTYQVNGTVLSVTGDALFAATWAVFSDVQTVTPTLRLGLRLPYTSEALTQSDTPTGRLTVARALTVNRLAQSATALALVTVRRNLVTLIPLVSASPVAFWRTLCVMDAACLVETLDVTADLWVARWLVSVAVAAGRTPDAVLTYEEMLAQGRLQMQFSARGPEGRFVAKGPVVRFRVRGAPD